MSYFKQPVLLMFLGSPGSGKSYFAKGVADKINAIRINGDSMRLAIFGSLEAIEEVYQKEGRAKLNEYTFNALNYVTEQILARGNDLIYDANHNKWADRQDLERLAATYNAKPLLIWIKTPLEVAIKRGQTREAQIDQRQLAEEKMRESVGRHQSNTDEPTENELVIAIDGEMPFESQFEEFRKQLEEISER